MRWSLSLILFVVICFGIQLIDASANIQSPNPIWVGGLFKTAGLSQSLQSFAEYSQDTATWTNLNTSSVLSAGTIQSVTLIESNNTVNGVIFSGIFNYLNHSQTSANFGNIVLYNVTSNQWQPLGAGCDGAITSVTTYSVVADGFPESAPYITVVIAGLFKSCNQGDASGTIISFSNGLGFFDLYKKTWYKPTNQTDLPAVKIQEIIVSPDFTYLYLVGNDADIGYAYKGQISATTGPIANLNWTPFAQSSPLEKSAFYTIEADIYGGCYVGGDFEQIIGSQNTHVTFNVFYFNGTEISPIGGGTLGPVVSIAVMYDPPVDNTTLPVFKYMYAAGDFTEINQVVDGDTYLQARSIAQWNGTTWSNLGQGIIFDQEFRNNDGLPEIDVSAWRGVVIVGGAINNAGGSYVNNMAMWNTSNLVWTPVGNDTDYAHFRMSPYALSFQGNIYVAGQSLNNNLFSYVATSGFPIVENILCNYNLVNNTWGHNEFNMFLVDGMVLAMAYYTDDTLLVGGAFRKIANKTNLNNVALFNTTDNSWTNLNNGVFGVVTTITVVDQNVFIAGVFDFQNATQGVRVANVGMWNTTSGWNNMAGGISGMYYDSSDPHSHPVVFDVKPSPDNQYVYVGGSFTMVINDQNGTPTNVTGLAAWNLQTGQWQVIQTLLQGVVYAIAVDDSKNLVYAGGHFSLSLSDGDYNNLAVLSIASTQVDAWHHIPPSCNNSFSECSDQYIYAITVFPNYQSSDTNANPIYIGGDIQNIQNIVINGAARLVNGKWASFGTGFSNHPVISSLQLTDDQLTLYIGGYFSYANSIPAIDIVAWSLTNSSFTALTPVDGWHGAVLTLLPAKGNATSVSTPDSEPRFKPLALVIIGGLALVILLLLAIIVVFLVIIARQPLKGHPRNPTDKTPLTEEERENWEDFYSYEWEVPYNLLEIAEPPVGRGRNGIVHRATYKGQEVAVKILKAEISSAYYVKDNLCRYASIMRSLRHPNVAHVVGACTDPLSLISECESLGSLADIIRISPGKLTRTRVKSITLEAARGMAFLHGQAPVFLHRNLTSDNVLINEYWSAKISDCGLTQTLTESGEYKLSPNKRWSAPEILEGAAPTTKSDVYSFGMVIFHMVSHTVPFSAEEREGNIKDLQSAIIGGLRPHIPTQFDIPAQTIKIISLCWQQDPKDRPDFRELLSIINDIPE